MGRHTHYVCQEVNLLPGAQSLSLWRNKATQTDKVTFPSDTIVQRKEKFNIVDFYWI